MFPYYVGVAFALRDAGLISPHTPLGGSSAGAIVAAAVACGVDEPTVMSGLFSLANEVRRGTRLNWALRSTLEELLDEDMVSRAQAHGLCIAYQRVLPWPKSCIVTEWDSKADLIDTICASCNWYVARERGRRAGSSHAGSIGG